MIAEVECPYCLEHVVELVKSTPPAGGGVQMECDNCGARGPIYDNKEEALEGWNEGILDLGVRLRKEGRKRL